MLTPAIFVADPPPLQTYPWPSVAPCMGLEAHFQAFLALDLQHQSCSSKPRGRCNTAQAAGVWARRPAARREPCSMTRAITCPRANLPVTSVPNAASIPHRRAIS